MVTIAIVLDLLVCKFYCEKSRKASESRREKEKPKRMTKIKWECRFNEAKRCMCMSEIVSINFWTVFYA